jgi:uncharacterized protein YecT (DUF1311 family)
MLIILKIYFKNMKKIAIISMLLNALMLVSVILLFYNINVIKKNFSIYKNSTKIKTIKKNAAITVDKTDPIYIYKSRKFPCDSGYTSYESNLCIGDKLNFADSLLNVTVKNNLKEFDYYIQRDKEAVLKVKDNTYFVNSVKTYIAQKENFIKSQKKWEEMRILNSEYVRIGCDGGTGCSGIVSSKEIKAVLERIQEIKERYN